MLVFKHLGPAGGSALQGRIEGKFPALLGWSITSVDLMQAPDASERRIRLTLTNAELETREHFTSHIIAGTGFRIDLARYSFLPEALRAHVRTHSNGAPVLNRHFQSSLKGLYMIGPVAQSSFGPLLRFAAGAEYAASQVTSKLQRDLARHRPSKSRAFDMVMPVRNIAE